MQRSNGRGRFYEKSLQNKDIKRYEFIGVGLFGCSPVRKLHLLDAGKIPL